MKSLFSLLAHCELIVLFSYKISAKLSFFSRKAIIVRQALFLALSHDLPATVDLTLVMINATNFLFSVVLFLVE